MNFKNLICFDESHNEGGRINTTYTSLKELLEKNNFECIALTDFPLTYEKLKKYNVLVIAGPDMSKFRASEIDDILKYVYDGGSLVLMSDAGGDSGHMTNLNKIAQLLGFLFNSDQVVDQKYNLGMETVPVLEQVTPHDITRGVASISYRAGCSITVTGEAQILFKSNQTSNPPSAPIMVLSNYGRGKAIGIGTYEIFRDRLLGGFNSKHHSTLALNIFQYLVASQPLEEAKIIVEDISEESTPLLKELAEIKNSKSALMQPDSRQDRIVEAKITPLKESSVTKEQEALLKTISQDITNLSTTFKDQVYTLSDLHERISEASLQFEKIASKFKNLDFNKLNDNISNLNIDVKKIIEDISKLLDQTSTVRTLFENFKLIQEEYKRNLRNLIDNINLTVNNAITTITRNIEEKLKQSDTSIIDLKKTVQEIFESVLEKKLLEFSKSQDEKLNVLETRLSEKLNTTLAELSKTPVIEEAKPQIYMEPGKSLVKKPVRKKIKTSPE